MGKEIFGLWFWKAKNTASASAWLEGLTVEEQRGGEHLWKKSRGERGSQSLGPESGNRSPGRARASSQRKVLTPFSNYSPLQGLDRTLTLGVQPQYEFWGDKPFKPQQVS